MSINYTAGAAVHSGTLPAPTINAAALGRKTLTQLGMQTGASGLAAPLNTGLSKTNRTSKVWQHNVLLAVVTTHAAAEHQESSE